MKNNIVKIMNTFFSSIVYGLCYSLIMFIFDRKIDLRQIVIAAIFYFIFMNIANYIAPRIKKNK
mgnify:CR=1 FL=1